MKAIVYLHGFNSSVNSHKATVCRDWFAAEHPRLEFVTPALGDDPDQIPTIIDTAMQRLLQGASEIVPSEIGLIGSSMGGFFANYFAERYGCPAVLINPAIYPQRLLRDYLGPQTNRYTGVDFVLEASMLDRLAEHVVTDMQQPQSRLVMVQEGDEVLDYREAVEFYRDAVLLLEAGGDHSFVGFENHLPALARFLFDA